MGEECHATKFLGERFRNHGGRPNGMTFMGRDTHSATARPTGRTICHEHLPTAGGQIFPENGPETIENDQTVQPLKTYSSAALSLFIHPARS